MPGYDEELSREITQKASQLMMHMVYRMGGRAAPASNKLGLKDRMALAYAKRTASDPRAAADARAVAAVEEAQGQEAFIDAHVADGVPYKTMAALDSASAAEVSRQLSYFGIEHYLRIGDMCGRERILTDAEHTAIGALTADDIAQRRDEGYYRQAVPEAAFEDMGPAEGSGFYEIYVPDRDLEAKIASGELDCGQAVAELLGGEYPENGDPSDFVDKLIRLDEGDYMALTALPTAQREFVEFHGIDELRRRLAGLDACLEARSEVFWNAFEEPTLEEIEALGLDPEEVLGRQFTARFKTMPWDEEASILTDSLDRLGVPWHVDVAEWPTNNAEGLAEVTVNERHVGYLKQVVDDFSGRVKGFSPSRVENYDELARAAEEGVNPTRVIDDSVWRTPPLPEESKHWVTSALDELKFEYALTEDPEEGTFVITAKESEFRRHGYRLNDAADTLTKVRPPEFREQAQKAYQLSEKAQASRAQANRRLNSARNRERTLQRQRNIKVTKDVQRSVKSAEAQKGITRETVKKLSLGK